MHIHYSILWNSHLLCNITGLGLLMCEFLAHTAVYDVCPNWPQRHWGDDTPGHTVHMITVLFICKIDASVPDTDFVLFAVELNKCNMSRNVDTKARAARALKLRSWTIHSNTATALKWDWIEWKRPFRAQEYTCCIRHVLKAVVIHRGNVIFQGTETWETRAYTLGTFTEIPVFPKFHLRGGFFFSIPITKCLSNSYFIRFPPIPITKYFPSSHSKRFFVPLWSVKIFINFHSKVFSMEVCFHHYNDERSHNNDIIFS